MGKNGGRFHDSNYQTEDQKKMPLETLKKMSVKMQIPRQTMHEIMENAKAQTAAIRNLQIPEHGHLWQVKKVTLPETNISP